MDVAPLDIPGCAEVRLRLHPDGRGSLVKVFQQSVLADQGHPLELREIFFSRSHQGVLRGMHFQLPPLDMIKLVFCLDGTILDAVVDLRVGSPTYGAHQMLELTSEQSNAMLVPRGCAHGFLSLSDNALVGYATTEEYDPERDSGVHWSSVGIPWPIDDPQVSDRDHALVPMADFVSPFTFDSAGSQ